MSSAANINFAILLTAPQYPSGWISGIPAITGLLDIMRHCSAEEKHDWINRGFTQPLITVQRAFFFQFVA
jgi:hypothetical protein